MNKKMIKLIVINLILLSIFKLVPEKQIEQVVEQVQNEIVEVTSRGETEERTATEIEETSKNIELTVDSDLRVLSNLTIEDYQKILANYTELQGIENALIEAEQQYQVNGLYILGLACEESCYGTSNFARTRNNLCGIGAYDSNTDKAVRFKSKSSCILYVAKLLHDNYLTENACYFNGYTPRAIDIKYCTDKQHADKIINITEKLVKKL